MIPKIDRNFGLPSKLTVYYLTGNRKLRESNPEANQPPDHHRLGQAHNSRTLRAPGHCLAERDVPERRPTHDHNQRAHHRSDLPVHESAIYESYRQLLHIHLFHRGM